MIGFALSLSLSLSLIFCFVLAPSGLGRVYPLLLVSCVTQLALTYGSIRGTFSGVLSSLADAIDLIKKSTRTVFVLFFSGASAATAATIALAGGLILLVFGPGSQPTVFRIPGIGDPKHQRFRCNDRSD